MPKYKEIDLTHPDLHIPGWCIAFCYPVSGPIVVKGPETIVMRYVNTNLQMCHFHIIKYRTIGWAKRHTIRPFKKKHTATWMVNRQGWTIKTYNNRSRKTYRLMKGPVVIATFRRVPKRFIKEFELYDRANIIYKLAQEIQQSEGK
jgi:hypothetical protein